MADSNFAGPRAKGVAVVTGGASGIGLALAKAYAERGVHVLIADIDEAAMRHARDELHGHDIDTAVVDLRDAASVERLGEVAAGLGPLTAVCLNAGVTAAGTPVWESPSESFNFIVDVNLRGLHNSIRVFVPTLVAQGAAADVIVTASIAGLIASPYSAGYAASKAGAVSLAKTLRAELASAAPDVRVALLAPGVVKTNIIRSSAALVPGGSDMSEELVSGSHDYIQQAGIEPDDAAASVLKALEEGRFWALPPESDAFMGALDAELTELRNAW